MAAPDTSASVLAWSWVVEALSAFPSVDVATLHGLIGSVPKLSDNLGKEAREMLAFRCLEGLYDPNKRFGGDDSSSFDNKGLDSCESFELVLNRVLEQTSVTSAGKGGLDKLANVRKVASNKQVRALVERKKAGLPRCALEQMRDRAKRKGAGSLATNINLVNGPGAHLEDRSVSETPVCLKRGRSSLLTEVLDVEGDQLPPRKKLRNGGDDVVASTEQEIAPVDGVQLSDDASRRIEVPQTVQEVQMGGRDIRTLFYDNGGDGAFASTEQEIAPVDGVQLSDDASQRIEVPQTVQEVQREGSEIRTLCNDNEEHLKPTSPEICQPQTVKEVQREGREIRTLCNDNEEHLKPTSPKICQPSEDASRRDVPLTEGEVPEAAQEVQIEGTRSRILSDANEEPVKPTCPQTSQLPDVCLMCKGGGKLLSCANSCRMVLHERCLGFPARLDSKGDFICPLCTHLHARVAYTEAKKNMLLAREELALFLGSKPVPWQLDRSNVELTSAETTSKDKEPVGPAIPSEAVLSKKKAAETTSKDKEPEGPAIPSEAVLSKQKGAYPVDKASKEKQHEDHLAPGNADIAPTCSKEGEGEDVTAGKVHHSKVQRKLQLKDLHGSGLHESNPKQQRHGQLKKAGAAEAKNLKNKPSRNCLRPQAEQELADQMMDALSASLDERDGASKDKICKDTRSKHSLMHQIKQNPTHLKDAYSASLNDSDGTSGEENGRATSKYSLRSPGKRVPNYDATPTAPLDRRIRLKWTEEEVEMLKEGVKRFGTHDMKAVPWRTILDFGSSVFLKGRTPVDLKDKWRNLVRSAQALS